MYFRKKTTGGRAYLQIVQARREGGRIRQQVIATLGRLDELAAKHHFTLTSKPTPLQDAAFKPIFYSWSPVEVLRPAEIRHF